MNSISCNFKKCLLRKEGKTKFCLVREVIFKAKK